MHKSICRLKRYLPLYSILVVFMLLIMYTPVEKSHATFTWWDADWRYRQPIIINNTADNLTDYQILIILNATNTGQNFTWNNDGKDLRFTFYNSTSEEETEIPYWIEYWDSSSKIAKVWIKVPFLPSNKDTTVYMYYGNPSANSKSDGEATFEFFDDFNGASLDTNKWSSYNAPPSYIVENGYLKMWGNWGGCCGGGCVYQHINTIKTFSKPIAVESRFMVTGNSRLTSCCEICYHVIFGDRDVIGISSACCGRVFRIGSSSSSASFTFPDKDQWHRVTMIFDENRLKLVTDYGNEGEFYGDVISSGHIGLAGDTDRNDGFDIVDWIAVRKYAYPEPTYTLGEEQVAIPTKPILVEPLDGIVTKGPTLTFKWNTSLNAQNYTILIDNTIDFSSPEISQTFDKSVTTCTIDISVLSEGKWYWKIIASNINGENESEIREFVYDRTPPPAPDLNLPIDGNVTDNKTVIFSWYPVNDSTVNTSYVSGIAYYELQISSSQNFDELLVDDTTAGTTLAEEVEGNLYWRVRAWDKAGNAGKFSEIRRLTVFSFTLSASSTEVQMQRGSSISINITTKVDFGEPENITLNYSWVGDIKPSYVNVSIGSTNLSGLSNYTTIAISSEGIASTGMFTCRVTAASSSGIKRWVDIKLTIYGMLFSLYCYPQEVTLTRSDEKQITISVEFDQGALDMVNLSGAWEEEPPKGVSVSIYPTSGIPPYQATLTITSTEDAEKGTFVYRIIGYGSGLERVLNIYIDLKTDLSIYVETDKDLYEKGDEIKIYGNVKDPFGNPVEKGKVTITISTGKASYDISASINEGVFNAGYHITFDKPEGEWHISVRARDDKGDTTPSPQNLTISVKSPETCKSLSVTVLSPSYGQVFERGETVTFTVMVTEGERKISGATVKGYLPDGDIITFSEGEPGLYTSSFTLRYDCKLGNWTVYIESTKDMDGVVEGGFGWVTFKVEPAKPIFQILSEFPDKIEAGEKITLKIKALYPDGTPVDDGIIKVLDPDGKEVVLDYLGSGIYTASFTPTKSETDWLVNITIADAYGNVISLDAGKINIVPPSPSTYAVRYWWATILFLSLAAVAAGSLTHRKLMFIKLDRYRREIQNLERQKRSAAERYFLKGEITREAYDKIIQECENRIAELSRKCGVLEKEIRKLRRKKS